MSELNDIALVAVSYNKDEGCLDLAFVDVKTHQNMTYHVPIRGYVTDIIEYYMRNDCNDIITARVKEAMSRQILGTCNSDIEFIRHRFREAAEMEIEDLKQAAAKAKEDIENEKKKMFNSMVSDLI